MKRWGIRSRTRAAANAWALAALIGACAAMGVGCAPTQAAEGTGAEAGDKAGAGAVEVAWSMDGDCTGCHTDHAAAQHADTACASCHQDEGALAKAHKGTTADTVLPKKLKKTDIADEVCLSCHYETREALIEATADVLLSDDEGTARNPHDAGGISEHEGLACADCHTLHDDADTRSVALKQCASCHHAGVFACHTCHD